MPHHRPTPRSTYLSRCCSRPAKPCARVGATSSTSWSGAPEPRILRALRGQLVRLHTAGVGRLVATVASRDDGGPRVGWVSWLLFADGWRSLTPVRRDGRPTVRLAPATPLDLGAQVAALVTLVRGRR